MWMLRWGLWPSNPPPGNGDTSMLLPCCHGSGEVSGETRGRVEAKLENVGGAEEGVL